MKLFSHIMLCLLLIGGALAINNISVNLETLNFKDQYNRTRIFHGQNVVVKEYPYYPVLDVYNTSMSFVEKDAQDLKKWGQNVIRLYMSWEGFEPERQNYNYEYLAKLKEIILLCQKYDIYVFLDAHQDLYSRFFCGEGMPDWTIMNNTNHTFPAPFKNIQLRRDDEGVPLIQDCLKVGFFEYYFTKDASQQGENLFLNYNGLADDFAAMWGKVAQYFASQGDEITHLLGYEIINEPFGVSPYNHFVDWLFGGRQNNKYLLPFYKKVSQKMRESDPNRLVFYETALFDFLGGGFESNLGTPEYEVLSYHIYCGVNNSQGDPSSSILCHILDTTFINAKEKNIKSMKVGGFLTEFGALTNSTKSSDELDFVLNKADKHLRSWAHWQYKGYGDITTQSNSDSEGFFDSNGNLQSNKVKHLSRPFAYAICSQGGEIISEFSPSKITYELSYLSGNCGGQQTEIYLSEEFWFTNKKIVKAENVQDLIAIEGQPKGYYKVIPINQNKQVHLVIKNK
ncbi:hypothetical protein ABPG74_000943 [Tetrahymena malaccensis]